ncbi:amiloride-sensitive sodium channel subunit beta, partial [Brachionus plicatilis]
LEYAESFLIKNNLVNRTDSTILDQMFPAQFSKFYFNFNIVRYLAFINLKSSLPQTNNTFSIPFNKMFISCIFSFQQCDENEWLWFYDTIYGNCYRFNTIQSKNQLSQVKKSYHTGKYNNLMLELYVGVSDVREYLSLTTGASIFINDNLIKPLVGEGFELMPGTNVNIILERKKNKQMARPYSECVNNLDSIDSFDSEYYRKVLRSNLTYRQIDCFYAYIQSEIYKRCKCDEIASNLILENNNPCETLEEQLCSSQTYQEITTSEYKTRIKEECPLECDSVSYSFIKSESRYPSASYAKEISKNDALKHLFNNRSNVSLEEYRENILAINIYYEFLKETEITESASISWDGLVGSIGGTLGLFMGISILSIVEFIDLFIQIIYKSLKINENKVFFIKK